MALTEWQKGRFNDYGNDNRYVFSDRVIQGFFKNEQHIELLLRLLDGDVISQMELEDRFRKHFFRVRFIKFLASTIKYCTIDQLRQNKKNDTRNPLIFDRSLSDDGEGTLGELLLSQQMLPEVEPIISNPTDFRSALKNENLANAFAELSEKQQFIITLCYAFCFKDNEVARMIGVSPQAVCKTRNLALHKLRQAMTERG